uniref:Uncharacterized protein n=1 Tax=Mycena chlorophos TaxID=658473 RepID=A0ABQ0M0E5_MYCCL|nr:predicted protein [Mycena chlorophos]
MRGPFAMLLLSACLIFAAPAPVATPLSSHRAVEGGPSRTTTTKTPLPTCIDFAETAQDTTAMPRRSAIETLVSDSEAPGYWSIDKQPKFPRFPEPQATAPPWKLGAAADTASEIE